MSVYKDMELNFRPRSLFLPPQLRRAPSVHVQEGESRSLDELRQSETCTHILFLHASVRYGFIVYFGCIHQYF